MKCKLEVLQDNLQRYLTALKSNFEEYQRTEDEQYLKGSIDTTEWILGLIEDI